MQVFKCYWYVAYQAMFRNKHSSSTPKAFDI